MKVERRLTLARFRRPTVEGTSWRKGWLAKTQGNLDQGIVAVVAEDSRGVYNVHAEYVEVEVRGPRGGHKWVAYGDA